MTVLAGQKALADDINTALAACLGGEVRGSDTAQITTTETVFATTGSSALSLAASATYRVDLFALHHCSVANDEFHFRIRDTALGGTVRFEAVTPKLSSIGIPYVLVGSFLWTTTTATTKKWVATVVRFSGTGYVKALSGAYLKATYIAPSGRIATI